MGSIGREGEFYLWHPFIETINGRVIVNCETVITVRFGFWAFHSSFCFVSTIHRKGSEFRTLNK